LTFDFYLFNYSFLVVGSTPSVFEGSAMFAHRSAQRPSARNKSLRSRRAFLENLESRQMMTTGGTTAIGGALGGSSYTYYESDTSTIDITFNFTRTLTGDPTTGTIRMSGTILPSGQLSLGTQSGVTLTLPSSGGSDITFSIASGSTMSAQATVKFNPAVDSNSTDDATIFLSPDWGTGMTGNFSSAITQYDLSNHSALEVNAHVQSICPTCPNPYNIASANTQTPGLQGTFYLDGPSAWTATNHTDSSFTSLPLHYDQGSLLQPTLIADAKLPPGTSSLQARLVVDYFASGSWHESTAITGNFTTPSGGSGDQWYRFSMPIPNTDTSGGALPSGAYKYLLDVHTTGSGFATRTATGEVPIVNPSDFDTGFGKGWNLDGLERLLPTDANSDGTIDATDGAASNGFYLVMPGGTRAWFPNTSSGFGRADGDFRDLSASFNSSTGKYTLTSLDGSQSVFGASGYLEKRTDKQGNEVNYTYSSGILSSITYPNGHEVDFTSSSGQISSVSEKIGSTTLYSTSLTWTGSHITSIGYSDPDAGGSLVAPHEDLVYSTTTGESDFITQRKLYPAESDATVETTTFAYNADHTLASISRPNLATDYVTPDSSNGAISSTAITLPTTDNSFATESVNGVATAYYYNAAGQVTKQIDNYIASGPIDPLKENVTTVNTYYTSADGVSSIVIGKLKSVTSSDPDGSGGESSYVTSYSYDGTSGYLATITYPDSTTEAYVYGDSSNPGLPTQITDRMGRIVELSYDSSGNLVRQQQVVGTTDTLDLVNHPYNDNQDDIVTTWEYSTPAWNGSTGVKVAGLASAMIVMAPNGTGGSQSVRTEYTYTTDGLLQNEKVAANVSGLAASTYLTYTSSDQLQRAYTELWNPDNYTGSSWASVASTGHYYEEYSYDALGRLTTKTQSDPDGSASTYTSPVWTYTYDRENRLKTVVDPISRLTTYAYQSNGSYSESLPDHDSNGYLTTTSYTIDGSGRVSSKIDPLYFVTSFAYDGLDRQTQVTSPDPDIVYTSSGSVSSNGSRTSPVTSTVYDALSRPSTETDALGNVTNYYYSNYGLTVEVRRPSPGGTLDRPVTKTEYNADGTVSIVTEGSVAYNATSSTAMTALRWTRYVYDGLGRNTEVWKTQPDATGAPTSSNEFKAEAYAYDKEGNQTSISTAISVSASGYSRTSPLMQTTSQVFDARNRLIERDEQDPDPGNGVTTDIPKWFFGYDLRSRMISEIDPSGNETDITFDRLDREITRMLADPDGAGSLGRPTYSTTYDAVGRTIKQIDPNGNYTQTTYDALDNDRVQYAKDSSGTALVTTNYWVDADGRMLVKVIADSRWTYDYDDLGNLTKLTQPDPDDSYAWGGSYSNAHPLARPYTTYTYDANGNQTTEVNELGKTTTLAYDNLNRLTSQTDPDPDASGSGLSAPVTSFSYDVFGNRLTLTDPDSNTTTWGYDLLDRQTTDTIVVSSVNKTRTTAYDVAGNKTSFTDRTGKVTLYTYDLLNRETQEDFKDSSGGSVTYTMNFNYDVNSRMSEATGHFAGISNIFDYTYTYNPADWLASETEAQSTYFTTVLTPSYDVAGQRTGLKGSFTIAGTTTNDFSNTYHYDAAGREDSVKQTSSGSGTGYSVVGDKYFAFAYDQLGNITDVDRYANLSGTQLVAHTDNTYDYLGRLTGIDHLKGSTHFSTYSQTYDARSRITAIDDVFSNLAWSETHDFTYDNDDQLTATNHSVQNDESYAYDVNGNRTGSQTHLGATNSSTVTGNNRVTSDGVYNYTYDDEGNITKKVQLVSGSPTGATEEYAWDNRERLKQVTFKPSPTGTATHYIYYQYDYLNRIHRRLDDADGPGSGGTTVDFYTYDGNQIAQVFHKNLTGNAFLTNRYVWGPQVDQLLSDEQMTSLSSAGTVYFALTDHLGSVRDLVTYNSGTDTTTVAKHRNYDSFGNVTTDSASGVLEMFSYTAKMFDTATGKQWNWRRWYDPIIGSWMSPDPIGFNGGTENLREYVGNNVITAVDPTGLVDVDIVSRTPFDLGDGASFPFAGGTGTVKVYKDVSLKVPGLIQKKWIELSFTADVDIPADTHWLQFVMVKYFKDGEEEKGAHGIQIGDPLTDIKQSNGVWYVDCGHLPKQVALPYYSSSPGTNMIRSPRELSIFDRPVAVLHAGESTESYFQSFLISGGKPIYLVTWTAVGEMVDGKYNITYKDIKGQAPNGLPAGMQDDEISIGVIPGVKGRKDVDVKYKNPVLKEHREFRFSN
jgi:RHS repeat-associated protein